MIIADKGKFQISGDFTSKVYELNAIIDYFTNHNPEVLGGTLAVWGDKLKDVLSTGIADIELLDLTKHMAEKYIELNEGEKHE